MNPNDINRLFEAAKSGDSQKAREAGEAAAGNLSRQQREQLDRALSDGDFLQQLLKSDKAQELLRQFGKKGE